jgi:hypothetical protein
MSWRLARRRGRRLPAAALLRRGQPDGQGYSVAVGTLSSIRGSSDLDELSMTEYLVIHEQTADGTWDPASPHAEGEFALGVTRIEVEARRREAFAAQLGSRSDQRDPLAVPHAAARPLAA